MEENILNQTASELSDDKLNDVSGGFYVPNGAPTCSFVQKPNNPVGYCDKAYTQACCQAFCGCWGTENCDHGTHIVDNSTNPPVSKHPYPTAADWQV